MRDEERPCECGETHKWGIVGASDDGVPLYGARPTETCDNYRAKVTTLPTHLNAQELWAQTGDLDPQATLATRAIVARLRTLGKDDPAKQWPEFAGFVISQITDMRGALVRDESKFAHLVAHTDEIVEAMRGVVQLSEKLTVQQLMLREITERLNQVQADLNQLRVTRKADDVTAYGHFGLSVPEIATGSWTWDDRWTLGNKRDDILTDASDVDEEEYRDRS